MTMHERDRDDAGAETGGTGGTTEDFRERAMPPDLAGDHAATGEGTAPVAHGAAGPPLQQHQESTEMIYGRQEGGGADEREGAAAAREHEGTAAAQESQGGTGTPERQGDAGASGTGSGAQEQELPPGTTTFRAGGTEDRDSGKGGDDMTDTETAPGGQDTGATGQEHAPAGQPAASDAGKWPLRADDPQFSQDAGDGGQPGDGGSDLLRTSDAASGAGPYMDPAEDLERHGATTGLAANAPSGSWSGVAARYRQHWQSRQDADGGRWEDAEPGYRYGHEMASDARYRGREWNDVETDLRSGYAGWSRNQDRPEAEDDGAWERVKGMARDGWDTVRGAGGSGGDGGRNRAE